MNRNKWPSERWRFRSRIAVTPAHRSQHAVCSFQPADLRTGENFDVVQAADTIDQIVRHRGFEGAAAYHHPELPHFRGEIDHRLSGRITGADERDLLIRA